MSSQFCTRDQSALVEATRDPIFLLLVETAQLLDYDEDDRPDSMERDDDGVLRWKAGGEEIGARVAFDDIVELRDKDFPITVETRVESVWLTRQEGEAWIESHRYRFGPDQRARIYCVCAEGELAQALRDGSEASR